MTGKPDRADPIDVMIENGRFMPDVLLESMHLHNPQWTPSDGVANLIKSDIDTYVFVDKMRLMFDNLIMRMESSDRRLTEHHDAIGVPPDRCPICVALRERNELRTELLYGEVSVYCILALAVAEYRFRFDAWPTEAQGRYLSLLPEGVWDEELADRVQERLDLSADDGGAEIVAAGLEGLCGHASGAVTIGSDEYTEAARWLYGELWSPGIEDSWLMASEEEEELSDRASKVEQEAYDQAEHPRYWETHAAKDFYGGRPPRDDVPGPWAETYLTAYAAARELHQKALDRTALDPEV